jgi:abhydrolase domain-containing protein 6
MLQTKPQKLSEWAARAAKFVYLKRFERPARKLPEHDAIKLSETKADAAISVVFKSFLNRFGLVSYQVPTRFGMMHCYDSNPQSTQPALLMLHGIGSSGQCFSWLALMLRDRRRIILPDLFHFCGFSNPNNGVMNVQEHKESVLDLLNTLGLEQVDFCGLSLGGWIGLKLAIQNPTRVRTLTLLNSAGLDYKSHALRDTLSHLTWKKFQILYPGLMRAFPYTGAPGLSSIFGRSLYRLLKQDSVRNFLKTIHSPDFVDKELSEIQCPTLVLWGHEDRLLSEEIALDFTHKIQNCSGFFVERCAHILCLEAPLNVYNHINQVLGTLGQPHNSFARLLMKTAQHFPESPIAPKGQPK